GRVRAELEADLLVRDLAADSPADRGRTGEGDRGGQLVFDDRVADLGAAAGNDAEPAGGQAGIDQDLGQLDRGDRGLAGRLENHRVARGDCRAKLVADQ